MFKLNRRDFAAAFVAAGITATGFALAQTKSINVIGASTYPWSSLAVNKTAVGETRQVLKGPTATLEELEVHITTLDPGQTSHPPHQHANEELILLDTGKVETLSSGKWVGLGPGSVIFNSSGSLHGLRNAGKVPARYFVVNWRTPATDALAAKTSAASPHSHP